MRICIFTTTIDKRGGGPSRSVPILARGLSCNDVETILFTCKSEQMNDHLVDKADIEMKIFSPAISIKELEQEVISGDYDLIHCQNLWAPLYHKMAKIARKHHIPYMMTPRGCLEPWAYQGQGLLKNLKKRVAMLLYQKRDLQKSVCILATSTMEAENLRALGINTPIAVIPNGIDISEYRCRSWDFRKYVKKQIVFLSRIHEKKGIEFLIDAWSELKARYPDWNVVIAGNGEEAYIDHLKGMIAKQGLSDCMKIIPPVYGEAKHQLYCESSLFILPSYSENFGMVIAEAMSCGVPVITTNGTPWQELNEKQLGWCIELSLENVANAISEAINLGQDKLFEMGQQCSEYVRDTYQYTEVAAKNKAVYEWILNGGKKPAYIV